MRGTSVILIAAAVALFLLLSPVESAQQVTVFAAASLTNALEEVDSAFTKKTGVAVRESFAASSTLARQIEAGGPAQIFISADTKWMDYLIGKGLIAMDAPLLGNTLALIASRDSPFGPRAIDSQVDWSSLLGHDGRLAVGDPDHVPAGIYAEEALKRLGAWGALEPRLARAEDVRGALALVERGDAPLGIVYVTDARASTNVKIVGVFPADSHAPIVYPAAIIKGAESGPVRAYYQYLHSPAARAVFLHYGFALR